jgi:GST-like protein
MIDLYFAPTSNGYRAAVALAECGLDYRVQRIDLTKGEQRSPEYLKINPFGAIPAIVDPDGPGGKPLALAQSGAILLYAAEKSGRFLPKDPVARAEAWQWMMAAATDVAPASTMIFYCGNRLPEKSATNASYFETRLVDILKAFDARLAGRDWLAGEISVADLALYPVVAGRRELLEKSGAVANVLRWAERMAARPGVKKAYAA